MLSAELSKSVSFKGSKKKLTEQDSKSSSNRKSLNGNKSKNDNANLNKQQLLKPRSSVFKQKRKSDSTCRLKQKQLYKPKTHDWRQRRSPRARKLRKRGLHLSKQQLQLQHSRLPKLLNSRPNWRQRPKPSHSDSRKRHMSKNSN
jgi:hypothetical protein